MSQLIIAMFIIATFGTHAFAQSPRPVVDDCFIPVQTTATTATYSLFPENYYLIGDNQQNLDDRITITSARGFSVEYFDTYKVVTDSIANLTYVLVQCGAAPPPQDKIPAGATVFQIPLTSISATETVPYAYLEVLGLQDRVSSVSSFVTSSCGQAMVECGKVAPDLYSLDSTNATQMNAAFDENAIDAALSSYPIPGTATLVFSGASDPGILNRAEWLKFLGLFFNRERAASDTFNTIKAEYDRVKASAAAKTSQEGTLDKPLVAWVQAFSYNPDESFILSFAPYKAELTQDAGGRMLDYETIKAIPGVTVNSYTQDDLEFKYKGEGAGFDSKEEALAALLEATKDVDVAIDETYSFAPRDYDLKAFLEGYGIDVITEESPKFLQDNGKNVFRFDGRLSSTDGMDWYETAVVRADRALKDLVQALGTDDSTGSNESAEEEFVWFRNINAAPKVVTAGACSAKTGCDAAPPAVICPFVKPCMDGTTALLKDTDDGLCSYSDCVEVSSVDDGASLGELEDVEGAAAANGAPAVLAPATYLAMAIAAFLF
jgi:hypothetical protein